MNDQGQASDIRVRHERQRKGIIRIGQSVLVHPLNEIMDEACAIANVVAKAKLQLTSCLSVASTGASRS